jgi:hypothetical protein
MALDLSTAPCIFIRHGASEMAFFNDLVKAIATAEGIDQMTVRGVGINVREGGFIAKGGRGLSAAKMTAKDAAALLIGVNACSSAAKAAEVVRAYQELRLQTIFPARNKIKGAAGLTFSERRKFGHVVEGLIELCIPTIGHIDLVGHVFSKGINFGKDVRSRLDQGCNFDEVVRLEISFVRPLASAIFEIKDALSSEVILRAEYGAVSMHQAPDRYDITRISQKTIRAVGSVLYS